MQAKTNTQKATEGGIGVAAVVILSWGLKEVAGVDVPGEVQAAIAFIIGYLIPSVKK